MPSGGKYTERLPCGGELTVSHAGWSIEYYFRGPDLRYHGTFVSIPSAEIEKCIDAFERNWVEYNRLSEMTPLGGTLEKPAEGGMVIRVGGPFCGVCLRQHHMPLSTREEVDRVVKSYRYAIDRARQIQRFLTSV